AAARRSGYRARQPAPPPTPACSRQRLRRRGTVRAAAGRRRRCDRRVLDHAVELLAGLDHAQLAARAFLDRGLAFLQVLDLGGERVVALLQAFVVALLFGDLGLEHHHLARVARAEPEAVLQAGQQYRQHQQQPAPVAHGPSALERDERVTPGVTRAGAEGFLDAQQLVVLGHAVAAAQRAGLDLGGG